MTRAYDSSPQTLDPGLTALALRARARRDERYEFVRPTRLTWWRRRLRAWTRRKEKAAWSER